MKKNPSRCTARTPQSQEVSIPTPTGSMTATTQPLSCTKGMTMKYKTKPQFRLQMRGEPDWLYRLKRVEWAEGMVRLDGLTKADIPSL